MDETLAFFESLGIACKTEDEGKVYPHSDQASAVLDVLRYELEQQRVTLRRGRGRRRHRAEGAAASCSSSTTAGEFGASRVVLASGGRAGPQFGSNGSGYRLAQRLGHRVIEPLPGIVSLRLGASFLPRLKGVKFIGTVEGRAGDDVAAKGGRRDPVHRLRHLGAPGAAGQPRGAGRRRVGVARARRGWRSICSPT